MTRVDYTSTIYAFDLPGYPEHHTIYDSDPQAGFLAWVHRAHGDEVWDVLHGPQPPAVQGPSEALPF